MNTIAALIGRILLAVIFVVSGLNKLFDIGTTETMITGAGLPSGLAIPTAMFEIIGGLAIALGFMTRLFSILFAGFCLLTILFFHRNFADSMQTAMALKNLAMAGGFLCLFAYSQMRWSYESMQIARRGEIATREAQDRTREAELRAARAEGQVAAIGTVPAATIPVSSIPAETVVVADPVVQQRRRWWSLNT